MAWAWTTVGSLGLALAAFTLAAGVLVVASDPRRLQNRLLGLVLYGQAGLAMGGLGLMYLTDDPAATFAWQIAAWVAFAPVPWLYAAFLSTLPTPLAKPLAQARPLLYLVAGAAGVWVLLDPAAFVTGVVPETFAPWDIVANAGYRRLLLVPSIASGILGLAVAVWAYRLATPGSSARAQAGAYLLAFAAFDAKNLVTSFVAGATNTFPTWLLLTEIALSFAFVVLLVYGALKTQLFDVDLKIKWTLRRGTVASAFIAAFVVSTAIAERYLEQYGTLVGGAAAGLLFLAFRPIERVADRLADRAMPGVQDTAEYRTVKKREVYRAAVEGALEDGGVSDKERAMLARLAHQLGLGPLEMHDIERDVRHARGAG